MSIPPIERPEKIAGGENPQQQKLQHILMTHCRSVPAYTPAGCNLVVMPQGAPPFSLNAGHLPPNAAQHWGSVSKQFTAACMAQLIGQDWKGHRVGWNDDIRLYLPELPEFKLSGQAQKVTIDDLLHMRSGLPEMTTLAVLAGKNDQTISMKERLDLLARFPALQFKPDSEQMYCNTNYYLLAEIVELVSGRPFPDFAREELFAPLGMHCRCAADLSCPRTVEGYDEHYKLHTTPCKSWGATGMVGRPSDMALWNEALERGDLNALLVPSPQAHPKPGEPVYCRGLNQAVKGDYRIIYHAGAIDGFTTQFMRYEHLKDPSKTFAFFVAANIENIPMVLAISNEIAGVLAGNEAQLAIGGPPEPPRPMIIPPAKARPYAGTYDGPLGVRYKVEVKKEKGTWVLALSTDNREIVKFVPTQDAEGAIVFRGPVGDWIEKTGAGFVLKGAGTAPFPFTRQS